PHPRRLAHQEPPPAPARRLAGRARHPARRLRGGMRRQSRMSGDADDAFLWLEEVEGAAALDWVRRENARSLAALEADPRHQALYRDALAVVTAPDRIPYPRFLGERLANFWQDEQHVRGLWRSTSLASFATTEPEWRTLLDIDALAAAESRNWVFQGASVLPPDYRR